MLKILIVEDDRFISAVYSLFLKNLNYQIVGCCKNGSEAIRECEEKRPDIVLMDIHIEGNLDGIQTAERIKVECEIPVIYVTSDTSSEMVKRAVSSNSYGYLVKPVNEKELGITMELAYYKHKADIDQKRREERFRSFVSQAPMPIIIVQEGTIRYLNDLSLNLFRTHYMEDIVMLPLQDFVQEKDHEALNKLLDTPTDTEFKPFRLCLKTLHGQAVQVMTYCSGIRFNDKPALQIGFADLKEQLIALDNHKKWKEAVLWGEGPLLLLSAAEKIVDYNPGFARLLKHHGDLKGASPASLGPDLQLEINAGEEQAGGGDETHRVISARIGSREFKARVYQLQNSAGESGNLLLSFISEES